MSYWYNSGTEMGGSKSCSAIVDQAMYCFAEEENKTDIIIGKFVLDSSESVLPCCENEMLQLLMDQ